MLLWELYDTHESTLQGKYRIARWLLKQVVYILTIEI
jgi:hypothetical protein